MEHESDEILEYWNREDVESMYDKHLLNAEIEIIRRHIPPNSKILDAGCGEGEGTLAYSSIPGVKVHAVDFSEMRLKKAAERLKGRDNVLFKQVDFRKPHNLTDYDIVISQRFLINLTDWDIQKKGLLNFMSMLKSGGNLLMLEGSQDGAASLNEFRSAMGLDPIPIKWHNLFFNDRLLVEFMKEHGYDLIEQDGLGAYFLLTRGIRPKLDKGVNWDCEFNQLAATKKIRDLLGFCTNFSRLKLWIFRK